jgi:hypothetical protein
MSTATALTASTIEVRAHQFNQVRFSGYYDVMEHRWDYGDFLEEKNRDWFHDWISVDCVLADDERNLVWCGITNFAADIFHVFDRSTGRFESLKFASIGNRYDAKFHRALEWGADGKIWAATALLHDVDRYLDAPGGAIVRCDPATRELEIIARPLPHIYIQGITLDLSRGLMYGQTFTPEHVFIFDLETHNFRDLGVIGSGFAMGQSETLAIDRRGTLWGTWSLTRAWLNTPGNDQFRLWNYHPDRGRIEFLDRGLPTLSNRGGFAHADGVHTGPDGAVYMGTAEGLLCRIDPEDHSIQVIGKPGPHRRLAAMANGPDGNLYGAAGREGAATLFRYDPRNELLEDLGIIYDAELQERAFQLHDMTITSDGTIYAGENDVPHRGGFLWEISNAMAVRPGAVREE